MTQHYEVFGGTLSSDMEIEELPVSATLPADWTLRVLDGPAPAIGRALCAAPIRDRHA
jgi:hypothetical protein